MNQLIMKLKQNDSRPGGSHDSNTGAAESGKNRRNNQTITRWLCRSTKNIEIPLTQRTLLSFLMVRAFFYDEPGTTGFWSCSSKSETVMGLLYGLGVFPILLTAATVVESVFLVLESVVETMVRLERGGLETGRNEQHSKSWAILIAISPSIS